MKIVCINPPKIVKRILKLFVRNSDPTYRLLFVSVWDTGAE